ncbi:hypothetical protein H8D30_04250 [bacterium]|nr:hypothetical protein [bacterium]
MSPERPASEDRQGEPEPAPESPPKKRMLSLQGLLDALRALFVRTPRELPVPPSEENAPLETEPDSPSEEPPDLESPSNKEHLDSDKEEVQDKVASNPLSGKGLLEAFRFLLRGKDSEEPSTITPPTPENQGDEPPPKRGFSWGNILDGLGAIGRLGAPKSPTIAVVIPQSFGAPSQDTPQGNSPLPLTSLLGRAPPLPPHRKERTLQRLLQVPCGFAHLQILSEWPPPGVRPSGGFLWEKSPTWLAGRTTGTGVLRHLDAQSEVGPGRIVWGEPKWDNPSRGLVHSFLMGPGKVKESVVQKWLSEVFLRAGQSLDSAFQEILEREATKDGERFLPILPLLSAVAETPLSLGGRSGLFGLLKPKPTPPSPPSLETLKAWLNLLTVPATIHSLLPHYRKSRIATLTAIVPSQSRITLGWENLEIEDLEGEKVLVPRASLGEPTMTLHPRKDLMWGTTGGAWNRKRDEGEVGWMARLAIEKAIHYGGWLNLLEKEALSGWQAVCNLLDEGPTLQLTGERRWPWTEMLVAQVMGDRKDLPEISEEVLSRINPESHGGVGSPQSPFGSHVREIIRAVGEEY